MIHRHGITNIIRLENKFMKIVWLLCFLTSTIYCFYSIVAIIISFLNFDVLTISTVVTETPVDFPAGKK
jgi:hypothetical protein